MPRPDTRDWNVLAVAAEGPAGRATGRALAALGRLGEFRTAGYPRVIVGTVAREDGADLAAGLGPVLAGEPPFLECLHRIMPVERTLPFVRDDVTETLCEALEDAGPRLAGRSFYLRVHLRGLKGRLEHPAVERALGGFLFERAAAAGAPARVTFSDPDVVVLCEVIGLRVGYAFIERPLRAATLLRVR